MTKILDGTLPIVSPQTNYWGHVPHVSPGFGAYGLNMLLVSFYRTLNIFQLID